MQSFHISKPRIITVDKNSVYPIAIEQLKKEQRIPIGTQIRRIKYLNNIVEQDHRFIKKRIRSILSGVEAMHMVKKEQMDLRNQFVQNQNIFIHQLFGLTA
ncbi:putative transposase [Bacillus mycoides NBRC 101238 = DSM 11821]|nr:putative transposase [Bacillus mycoides NBRC 101238 = DSM 11821]